MTICPTYNEWSPYKKWTPYDMNYYKDDPTYYKEDTPTEEIAGYYQLRSSYKKYRFLGLYHRTDGPAIITPYAKYWYLSGHHYSFKGYCKTLKKYYGKTDADIFLLGLKYG